MFPLNDSIFYLSESATHQEEYFLKHNHYYGTINTCLSMQIPIGNLLKPDCATRILEENQHTTTEETCPSQFKLLSLHKLSKARDLC